MMSRISVLQLVLLLSFALIDSRAAFAQETAREATERHERVAERRKHVHVICHRGAVEFAHENTLEAYRAAFELGADGNEIDIRVTSDGVLVCFHDDMIDHLLKGYGDVGDFTWDQLRRIPFRDPGRFGRHCRIPTLREVFQLHRRHAGLMHLDVKRPGLVAPISALLDEFDMWDHVMQAPGEFVDPRIVRTRYKASLYGDRSEVDMKSVTAALERPGEAIIVEYPRAVGIALGRTIGAPSTEPVTSEPAAWSRIDEATRSSDPRSVERLLGVLQDAGDAKVVARGERAEARSAERILARATAADELARRGVRSEEVFTALEQRVRDRSLHRDWRYCGLDGIAALRALVSLKSPRAVPLARFCLWRDDPAVEAARNPDFADNPRSWTDWRTKMPVFGLLESMPDPDTERICLDYLALSDQEARRIGPERFESAARCLLAIRPTEDTARRLLAHRLQVVRGRMILFCLSRADEPWSAGILRDEAPWALRDSGNNNDN